MKDLNLLESWFGQKLAECVCPSIWMKCFKIWGTKRILGAFKITLLASSMVGLIGGDEHVEDFGRQHKDIPWRWPLCEWLPPDLKTYQIPADLGMGLIHFNLQLEKEQSTAGNRAELTFLQSENLKLYLLGFIFQNDSSCVGSLCY